MGLAARLGPSSTRVRQLRRPAVRASGLSQRCGAEAKGGLRKRRSGFGDGIGQQVRGSAEGPCLRRRHGVDL